MTSPIESWALICKYVFLLAILIVLISRAPPFHKHCQHNVNIIFKSIYMINILSVGLCSLISRATSTMAINKADAQ